MKKFLFKIFFIISIVCFLVFSNVDARKKIPCKLWKIPDTTTTICVPDFWPNDPNVLAGGIIDFGENLVLLCLHEKGDYNEWFAIVVLKALPFTAVAYTYLDYDGKIARYWICDAYNSPLEEVTLEEQQQFLYYLDMKLSGYKSQDI